MPKPLVSIIVPTYNRAHLISETLDSFIAQTYTNWECLVVDDGSTDNTDEVMAGYVSRDSRFQYHHRPKNRLPGGNEARNYGFEISKGTFVQWFDDDDIMLPNFLNMKVENIEDADFIICSCSQTDENLKIKKDLDMVIETNLFKDYVLWRFRIITHSVLFKRSFLENKMLFNPKIRRGQEAEFFSRIFFNVVPSQYKILNTPLFLYRQHTETKSQRNKKYNSSYAWSKSYINVENLRRGILIKDKEIVDIYLKRFTNLFFKSIYNNDKKTAKYILSQSSVLKKLSMKLYLEFVFIGQYLIHCDKGRHFFHQRWRQRVSDTALNINDLK